MILTSDFRNSRWLSQFGNGKFEERLNYAQIWDTAVFEVADYVLAIRLLKFNMSVKSSRQLRFCLKLV